MHEIAAFKEAKPTFNEVIIKMGKLQLDEMALNVLLAT